MQHLKEIHSDAYYSLYAHMKRDFPQGELAPFFAIKRNLNRKIYTAYYLTDSRDIGYAIVTAPPGLKYALLNYFAVYPEYRSQGYGGAFMDIIRERYRDRALVLEAEDPTAQKNAERRCAATRRIAFYERAGFRTLPTARAKIFGTDMSIMMCGADNGTANETSRDGAREIMHSLYLPALGSKEWLRFVDVVD